MKLYHGSLEKVVVPVLNKSKKGNDFGKGFYLTSSFEQADKWSKRNMKVKHKEQSYISIFEIFDFNDLKILRFESPNDEWLKFIISNRKCEKLDNNFDLIIGPVANDQVYNTIALLEGELIDANKAIELLKTQKLFDQYLFCSEKSLSKLKFVSCIEVT